MNKGQLAVRLKDEGQTYEDIVRLMNLKDTNSARRLVAEGRDSPRQRSIGRKHIFIPDTQCGPGDELDHLLWAGKYIAEQRPDVLVHAGDHWHMESLSSYETKGSKFMEGRRYKADIEAGNRGLELLEKGLNGFTPEGKVMLRGNHECVEESTEVLTIDGWVMASSVTLSSVVASFDMETGFIQYAEPIATRYYRGVPLLALRGDLSDELVSENHSFIVDGNRRNLPANTSLNHSRLRYAGWSRGSSYRFTPSQIELLTWVVADGTLVFTKTGAVKRIQFRLAKPRKIAALKELLDSQGIPYTEKPSAPSGLGSLPVTCIRIYGDAARYIATDLLQNEKRFPDDAWMMGRPQFDAFLRAIAQTDGSWHCNQIMWHTTNLIDAENIQRAAIHNGVPCKVTPSKPNRSAFQNGKQQWTVNLLPMGQSDQRRVQSTDAGIGNVVAIQTVDQTLITRRNGKVAFTGNSRILRAVNEDPRLEEVIGYHDFNDIGLGWEVHEFLEPIKIDGLTYAHYFINPANGRPIGGNIDNRLRAVGFSFVAGHQQGLQWGRRELTNGVVQIGLVAGSFYQKVEHYRGPQARSEWRGLCVLHEVENGSYDPLFVSMNYLRMRYA